MNYKGLYLYILGAMTPLLVSAQSMTYNHDQMILDQFLVAETGAGTLGSSGWWADKYYDWFHEDYRGWASQRIHNKLFSRSATYYEVNKEEGYAEAIKDSLIKRAEIEALNMADRELDVEWLTEKDKIQRQQEILKRSIGDIIYYGGSQQDKQDWTTIYNMVQQSLDATHEAYMPNSQRKSVYLVLYRDLCVYNTTLNKLKAKWLAIREMKQRSEQNATFTRSRTVAAEAFGRWKLAWGGSGGNGGTPRGEGIEAE